MTVGAVVALTIGVAIVAVGVAGVIAKARLRAKYPPPGHMIDVGGYRLHLDCQGAGPPTVILEAGLGVEASLSWRHVQRAASEFARVCVYDRAGCGWSEASPRPRTAPVMVDELRSLLTAANIPGPFILVAHSYGGLVSRLYAATHPGEVAGMVLLDSAHEDQMHRFPQEAVASVDLEKMTRMMTLLSYLFSTGLPALLCSRIPLQAELPEPLENTARALLASSRKGMATMVAEQKGLRESQDQVRAVRDLGDIPLLVLSHGRATPLPKGQAITPEIEHRYEEIWQELQAELAALSTRGELIVAEESGHLIQLDEPSLVVEMIRRVAEKVST